MTDQHGTPDHYVVASHVEDDLIFEVLVFKDDASVVLQGVASAFFAAPRVRVRKADTPGEDPGLQGGDPVQTPNLASDQR